MGKKVLTLVDCKEELYNINPNIEILTTEDDLNGEYISKIKLSCLCKIHNEKWESLWCNLRAGKGCKKCKSDKITISNEKTKLNLDIIRARLALSLPHINILSEKYENNFSPLIVECTVHDKIWEASWSNLISYKYGCSQCSIDAHSGENHHKYNPNLSNEDRLIKSRHDIITSQNIKTWRYDVYHRDNFMCQCCNARAFKGKGSTVKLNAHHLNGWHWCIEERFDVNNGITLCEDCHKEFHSTFGIRNNTKEQFEDFLKLHL